MTKVGPEATPPEVAHVLVGVDGSDHAAVAVAWTALLAAGRAAVRATVVCAFDTPTSPVRSARTIVDGSAHEFEDEAIAVATDVAERLAALGLHAQPVAFEGTFVEAVAALHDRDRPDVVVLGHEPASLARDALLGSAVERLVRHCDVPVLVAR